MIMSFVFFPKPLRQAGILIYRKCCIKAPYEKFNLLSAKERPFRRLSIGGCSKVY